MIRIENEFAKLLYDLRRNRNGETKEIKKKLSEDEVAEVKRLAKLFDVPSVVIFRAINEGLIETLYLTDDLRDDKDSIIELDTTKFQLQGISYAYHSQSIIRSALGKLSLKRRISLAVTAGMDRMTATLYPLIVKIVWLRKELMSHELIAFLKDKFPRHSDAEYGAAIKKARKKAYKHVYYCRMNNTIPVTLREKADDAIVKYCNECQNPYSNCRNCHLGAWSPFLEKSDKFKKRSYNELMMAKERDKRNSNIPE